MGHKQTLEQASEMSALPPKADMCGVEIDVCFVPQADTAKTERELRPRRLGALDNPVTRNRHLAVTHRVSHVNGWHEKDKSVCLSDLSNLSDIDGFLRYRA